MLSWVLGTFQPRDAYQQLRLPRGVRGCPDGSRRPPETREPGDEDTFAGDRLRGGGCIDPRSPIARRREPDSSRRPGSWGFAIGAQCGSLRDVSPSPGRCYPPAGEPGPRPRYPSAQERGASLSGPSADLSAMCRRAQIDVAPPGEPGPHSLPLSPGTWGSIVGAWCGSLRDVPPSPGRCPPSPGEPGPTLVAPHVAHHGARARARCLQASRGGVPVGRPGSSRGPSQSPERSQEPARASRPRPRMVAAGSSHTVLLRSDGTAVAFGANRYDQCHVPALDGGLSYTQVAAGYSHTVLLRSDGTAVAFGGNPQGQCNVPALDGGLSYTQVAAGYIHTVLLRSDGTAVAFGANGYDRCNVPALDGGLSYTQAAAGYSHTVLLRSDGTCHVPALDGALTYTARVLVGATLLLQASLDGGAVRFLTLGGVERCRVRVAPGAPLAGVRDWLAGELGAGRLGPGLGRADAALPGGRLLSGASAGETVADAFGL
ncbi:unnamed protein product [Prorocentrum cordatum]|uniref:Uncharacterized protein n=1 Tax=Prorocentrum cordatum TaxID=2364126 RepID=A0ABN9W5J8_9DINO|nr:unnamed protein product [Polarella glacialis]